MVKGKLLFVKFLKQNRNTFGPGWIDCIKLRMKRDLTSCICVLLPEARIFSGSL